MFTTKNVLGEVKFMPISRDKRKDPKQLMFVEGWTKLETNFSVSTMNLFIKIDNKSNTI